MKNAAIGAFIATLTIVIVAGVVWAQAEDAKGELIFDVKAFTSDVKMKKKILNQLKNGGLEWGMVENELVVTMVNRKFVKPNLGQLTRFGEQTSLKLDPGTYTLTCIGYWYRSYSRNIEEVLRESAFFNLAVASFTIYPDKTTRIEVLPTFQKRTESGFWVKVKVFSPDLLVTIFEGSEKTFYGYISSQLEESISWDDYSGPLKN